VAPNTAPGNIGKIIGTIKHTNRITEHFPNIIFRRYSTMGDIIGGISIFSVIILLSIYLPILF
jgi:hypothetical protein